MKTKLDKSLKKSMRLNNSFFSIAVILYFLLPSIAIYVFFFSKNVSAQSEIFTDKANNAEVINHEKSFNDIVAPYESIFGLNVVKVYKGDEEISTLTQKTTVAEVLEEINVTYNQDDIVLPNLEKEISKEAIIKIIDVNIDTVEERASIPFGTIKKVDSLKLNNYKAVTQTGKNGVLLKKYSTRYENGELVSKELISEVVEVQPVVEIITVGTKPITSYTGPNSCTYWDSVINNMTSKKDESDWLKNIMRCESACNTFQVSRDGSFYGLLQFLPSTFYVSFKGTDIFNGNQQLAFGLSIYRIGPSVRESQFPYCNK